MGVRTKRSTRLVLNLTIVAVGLVYALPLIWMLSTSLKPVEQTMTAPPTLLPSPVLDTPRYAMENYVGSVDAKGNPVTRGVWTDPVVDFPLFLRNSILVAILSVSGMVVSSAIVAYGFARVRWRGRGVVFGVLLATMMIPFPVLMGPLYVLFKELGWIGTFRPLWVPSWFAGAFNVFLLRQFFMTIPREIDEAARIDGCSHWATFVHVILPLSRPALAVVALLQFIAVWNDFLGPLVFLQRQDQFTLALGLALYQSQGGNVPWNLLMAASVLVLSPVLIVFVITQRTFVEGIATQGLKE